MVRAMPRAVAAVAGAAGVWAWWNTAGPATTAVFAEAWRTRTFGLRRFGRVGVDMLPELALLGAPGGAFLYLFRATRRASAAPGGGSAV